MEILFWEQLIYCYRCEALSFATGKTFEPWRCNRCGAIVAYGPSYYSRKGDHPKPFIFEVV